MATGACLETKC